MKLLKKYSIPILIFSTFAYPLLSYILLFRHKTLDGIAHFYPATEKVLFSIREFLLLHGLNTIPTLLFVLIMIFSFLAYFLALKVDATIRKTVIIAIVLQIITFFAFPVIESDIFSYMASDRVSTVYHQNVWKTTPLEAGPDRFHELADWTDFTRVYGGFNQFIYNFASKAGGEDLIKNILSYKLVTLAFTFFSIYIVFLIASKFFKGKEAFFIKLIFWNPLFLLNVIGAGHNDIIMLFFMLLSYYFYLKRSNLLSGISLALAIQTKLVGAMFFPFLFVDKVAKKDYKGALIFASATGIVSLAFFPAMGIGPIDFTLRVLQNSTIYWQGMPSLLFNFTKSSSPLFIIGFALTGLFLIFFQIRKKIDPIYVYCLVVFLYLIFFASAYWNWYVLWAFVFAPFIKNKALQAALIIFTATSTFGYAIYWLALRFDYQNILWQIILYLFILGIPFASFIYFLKFPNSRFNIFQEFTGSRSNK